MTVDQRPALSRVQLAMLVTPMIVLIIAAQVGDALAPSLVDRHPLLLIMLNARNRNLALTTVNLDAVSYYLVGTVRLMISDPLFYLLGWFYGETAIRWMERRTPTYGRLMRRFESAFRRAAYPLVFLAPNNPICLLAGASGMRPVPFFALNLSGTLTRLFVIRWLGEVFNDPIESILGFIQDYRVPLLVLTVSLVGWTFLREWRKGSSEVTSLAHLDEGLEEAREDLDAEAEELELVDAAMAVEVPDAEPDGSEEPSTPQPPSRWRWLGRFRRRATDPS